MSFLELACTQGRALWKLLRENRTRVTASELASVFHANPFRSRASVFRAKMGIPEPVRMGPAIQNGLDREHEAIQYFGHRFLPSGCWSQFKPGLVRVFEEPLLTCSPDAVFYSDEGLAVGVEVKVPWTAPIPRKPEEVPVHYACQAFACARIFGFPVWHLFFFDDEKPENSTCWLVHNEDPVWERMEPVVQEFLEQVNRKDEKKGLQRKSKQDWPRVELVKKIRVTPNFPLRK